MVQDSLYLNDKHRHLSYKLLIRYEDIFDRRLGERKTYPFDFELVNGAQPHSQSHYPVPHLYKQTFKKELDRLKKNSVYWKESNNLSGVHQLSSSRRKIIKSGSSHISDD